MIKKKKLATKPRKAAAPAKVVIDADQKTVSSKVRKYDIIWRWRWDREEFSEYVEGTNVDRANSKLRKSVMDEHSVRKPDVVILSTVERGRQNADA